MQMLRVTFATWRAAISEIMAKRAAFGFQMIVMILNDVMWIVFWLILFHNTGSIRGWEQSDMLTLFAVLTTVFGLAVGPFGNARRIGDLAVSGSLDSVLTIPVRPLNFVMIRQVNSFATGDLVFGLVLFTLSSEASLRRWGTFLATVTLGATIFVSFLVILGSLAMLIRGRTSHVRVGFDAVIMFAMYPLDIFGGPTKVALFTVLPSALIVATPVTVIRDQSWFGFGALVGAAAIFAITAMGTFGFALRHYRSGSQWTTT